MQRVSENSWIDDTFSWESAKLLQDRGLNLALEYCSRTQGDTFFLKKYSCFHSFRWDIFITSNNLVHSIYCAQHNAVLDPADVIKTFLFLTYSAGLAAFSRRHQWRYNFQCFLLNFHCTLTVSSKKSSFKRNFTPLYRPLLLIWGLKDPASFRFIWFLR